MKSFHANELNPYLQYKFLSGSVLPRPIVWVTTTNAEGKTNAAPFSFFNVVSTGKPILSVAVMNGGKQKDTAQNLLRTKEAVLHITDLDNVEEMNMTAASLESTQSETETFSIPTIPSETVKVESIQNAKIRFETKLFQHIPITENGVVLTDLFLLEVTNFVFEDDVLDLETAHINVEALKPVARLAGNDYAALGETFSIARPW